MSVNKKYTQTDLANFQLGRGVRVQYITDAQGLIDLNSTKEKAVIVRCLTEVEITSFVQNTDTTTGSTLVQGGTFSAGTVFYGDTYQIELDGGLACLFITPRFDPHEYTAPNIYHKP